MKNLWFVLSAGIALTVGSSLAQQQAAPPPPKLTTLADEPVSGQPGLHALIGQADWPVGGATPRHIHPGDEYATVLEGVIEITNDGQPPKRYSAGQAYHNSKDVVHTARNVGPGTAKTAIVLVIEKGKDASIPVK